MKKNIIIIFVIVLLLFLGVLFLVTSKETPLPQLNNTQYVFDIPFLIDKNIDEIRQILGEPSEGYPKEPNPIPLYNHTWINFFIKDGISLMITFEPETRKVVEFFLAGENKLELIKITNLKENNSDYRIEEVKNIKDSSKITGIKIFSK
ncbi:MAG: hypothetical protein ISS87_00685 [Candidatus Pacebacteria bacterium]|nr:hypothetical protein [Candidatus Paceibacterota bacterium]